MFAPVNSETCRDNARRPARLVDKALRGAKPTDPPIAQRPKFEPVVESQDREHFVITTSPCCWRDDRITLAHFPICTKLQLGLKTDEVASGVKPDIDGVIASRAAAVGFAGSSRQRSSSAG